MRLLVSDARFGEFAGLAQRRAVFGPGLRIPGRAFGGLGQRGSRLPRAGWSCDTGCRGWCTAPARSGYDCVSTCISRMACVASAAAHERRRAREIGIGPRRRLRNVPASAQPAHRHGAAAACEFGRRRRSGSAGAAPVRRGGAVTAGGGGAAGTSASTPALEHFGLAVARGLEFRQRREALLHALVVHTLFARLAVELVRGDGLFFERERLFFQQRVVFLELIGRSASSGRSDFMTSWPSLR